MPIASAFGPRHPSPNTMTPCFSCPLECKCGHPCSPQEIKEARSNDQSRGRQFARPIPRHRRIRRGAGGRRIKSGKWEFTTQMQLPGAVQSAPAGQAAGGNAPMTRTACIDAANPIPAEAQCKVDQVDRRGSLVTWAMTCNSPRGEIHSAGSARYAGNTMEGTVTARVPGPNGQPVDAPGHIAGRYLAPCDAK